MLNEAFYNSLFSNSDACGLCAIYRLSKMGIAACKIVGRAERREKILGDIYLVKTNLDIASRCYSEKEYLAQMVFPDKRNRICFAEKSCYYPEVRFSDL